MDEAGVPTAAFEVFDDPEDARKYVADRGGAFAVKADGLAAGKGVIVCGSVPEAEKAIQSLMVDGSESRCEV